MNDIFRLTSVIMLLLAVMPGAAFAAFPKAPRSELAPAPGKETAVIAGGCFWGVEGVFERLTGVINATSGYAGGSKETAKYNVVGTGRTGHAESVLIEYDPSVISYGTLLEVFFAIAHDPTELNYQGPDHGTQYRSAIFYSNDEQKRIAEEYIELLDSKRVFPKKIVTEVSKLAGFYPAEDYHQNFMVKNPDYPYIVYWDLPKIKRLESSYPGLIKAKKQM